MFDSKARLVFYEKAKLKSLIFLIVDLLPTDQTEIIGEMSFNIQNLKEQNRSLLSELCSIKKSVSEKEIEIRTITSKSFDLKKEYIKSLQSIDGIVGKKLQNFQTIFQNKLQKINRDVFNLTKNVEICKEKDYLKQISSQRLKQTLEDLQINFKKSQDKLICLEEKNEKMNESKTLLQQQINDMKVQLMKKQDTIDGLQEKIADLKKDMQNATVIITEKDKTNEELARDLVQANQMIVNFSNQIDKLSSDCDNLRQQLRLKDDFIGEQKLAMNKICEEFDDYRNRFRMEEFLSLKEDLLNARKEVENVEKQNRELSKCKSFCRLFM